MPTGIKADIMINSLKRMDKIKKLDCVPGGHVFQMWYFNDGVETELSVWGNSNLRVNKTGKDFDSGTGHRLPAGWPRLTMRQNK
jgi:hypothetical protein